VLVVVDGHSLATEFTSSITHLAHLHGRTKLDDGGLVAMGLFQNLDDVEVTAHGRRGVLLYAVAVRGVEHVLMVKADQVRRRDVGPGALEHLCRRENEQVAVHDRLSVENARCAL
jgi:hypothetical protein